MWDSSKSDPLILGNLHQQTPIKNGARMGPVQITAKDYFAYGSNTDLL